jgi:pyruvate-ferredoxin/flavodoxin oxidoreductase
MGRTATSQRQTIREQNIRLFALDAFRIAREEAGDPELRLRMQGIAFQGAFFAATTVAQDAGLARLN